MIQKKASKWRKYFDEADFAEHWSQHFNNPAEAAEWYEYFLWPEEAVDWANRGFTPRGAAYEVEMEEKRFRESIEEQFFRDREAWKPDRGYYW